VTTYIAGFSFLDKDSQVIWRIGDIGEQIPDSDEEVSNEISNTKFRSFKKVRL
jgi:hypothetical protein